MWLGILCGMAWRAWHGIRYGLASKECCMIWPGGLGMIWHGTCYGLAGITWYMEWPGGHRKVYGIAWQGMWKGIVLCALTSRDVEKNSRCL